MSIHTDKARAIAAKRGAWAGLDASLPLWRMSKRELVEIAARLGAMAIGDGSSSDAGIRIALNEAETLRSNGII